MAAFSLAGGTPTRRRTGASLRPPAIRDEGSGGQFQVRGLELFAVALDGRVEAGGEHSVSGLRVRTLSPAFTTASRSSSIPM
jgi:hypothetical protein